MLHRNSGRFLLHTVSSVRCQKTGEGDMKRKSDEMLRCFQWVRKQRKSYFCSETTFLRSWEICCVNKSLLPNVLFYHSRNDLLTFALICKNQIITLPACVRHRVIQVLSRAKSRIQSTVKHKLGRNKWRVPLLSVSKVTALKNTSWKFPTTAV